MEIAIPEENPPNQKWLIDILKELFKVTGLIPEPLRKALELGLETLVNKPYIAEVLIRGWNLFKTMERFGALEKLQNIFRSSEPVNIKELDLLIDQAKLPLEECSKINMYAAECKDIILFFDGKLKNFFNKFRNLRQYMMSEEAENMGKELAEKIQKLKEKLASDTIKNGVWLSSLILIVQFIKLKFVWDNIKEAQNLDKTSLPIIQSNLEKLAKGVELLASSMIRFEQNENLNDKKIIAKDIEFMVSEYGDIYNKTFTMIATLKVNIDGKIQIIYAGARTQLLDGVQNLAQTFDAGIKLYRFFDLLNKPWRLVQGGIVATYTLLVTANAVTYMISKSVLKDLNESMKELENLEKKLEDVGAKIHEARQWLREHIKLLALDSY